MINKYQLSNYNQRHPEHELRYIFRGELEALAGVRLTYAGFFNKYYRISGFTKRHIARPYLAIAVVSKNRLIYD